MAKPTQKDKLKADELIKLVIKQASSGISGDSHNRGHIKEAKRFINGKQWHEADLKQRENRPNLVIPKINASIDEAIGEQRLNMPGLKVRAADSVSEVEWAQIREAKIRHITSQPTAKMAVDKASEHQLQVGTGYLRVITERVSDDTWDQKISVIPVYNELGVIFPSTAVQWDRMDGHWLIVYERISTDAYKAEFGKEPTDLPIDGGQFTWRGDDDVVIAEYFEKEFTKKTQYLLQSGKVTEDGSMPPQFDTEKNYIGPYALDEDNLPKKRVINTYKIYRYKVDGAEILEEKQLWPSKYWPIVPVSGKEINEGSKVFRKGITKDAMDSQRMYNYYASCAAESYALAPKAKTYVTPEMIAGHENQWNNLNSRLDPFVLINSIDETNPANIVWPQQIAPPQASSAIVQGLVQASEDIRITSGNIGTPPYNAPSQEASGVALNARQRISDVGGYAYTDNLQRAFCRVGEIILDLFPTIYDTKRTIRTLGEDNISTKEYDINVPGTVTDQGPLSPNKLLNDMTVGKYEVVIDPGPPFSSARQEAVHIYTTLIQGAPQLMPVIGDILMKNQDVPESQLASFRIKAEMIRSGKHYLLTQEEIKEVLTRLPLVAMPPQPNPMMIRKMEESMAKAMKLLADAKKSEAQAGQISTELGIKLARELQQLSMLGMMPAQGPQQIAQPQIVNPNQGQVPQ